MFLQSRVGTTLVPFPPNQIVLIFSKNLISVECGAKWALSTFGDVECMQ